jgi:hypothetical protein
MTCLAFVSGCATVPFNQGEQYKQVEQLAKGFDWDSLISNERKIPSVSKMDAWQFRVHKAKALGPVEITKNGITYIAYTEENHRELLKQLIHGRLGWSIATDMQKGWEKEREEKHYIVRIAKLDNIQAQSVLKLWASAEDRNQALERKIMIDGVMHKITIFGIIAGLLLFAIVAL